jgi:hypothetical protein
MADRAPQPERRRPRASRQVRRLCRRCGIRVRVPAESFAQVALCPRCGATVPPDALVAAEGGPWRRAQRGERRRHDVVAGWLVSIALHMAILSVVVIVTWPSGGAPRMVGREREVGVLLPDEAPRIETGSVGRIRLEPLAGELSVPQIEDSPQIDPIRNVGEAEPSRSKIERIISIDVSGGGDMPAAMKGDWTSFAAGGGGTGAGGASFFGLGGRGRKFVFVVDRSGSMAGLKLDAAKAELIRAVRALERGAMFHTIFFNTVPAAMPPEELVRATEANKRRHFAWVSGIAAGGQTNPTSAMKLALSLKPDVIWLLSDGIFHGYAATAIQKANPRRKVQVHTIAFYSRQGEAILQRIAEENRGRYRFVSPASIGLDKRR